MSIPAPKATVAAAPATVNAPVSLTDRSTVSVSSVRPARVSSHLLSGASCSNRWPVSRAIPGAAIDTVGRSSSSTVSTTGACATTVATLGVAVSSTARSPSSTSLGMARILTEPVAAAWSAANVSVVAPPTNSQRASSSDVPATVTVNCASWVGSTDAVTVAVAPSASSDGVAESVSTEPSTNVAVPVASVADSAIRGSVDAGSDSVTVKVSPRSTRGASSSVSTDTLPTQLAPPDCDSNVPIDAGASVSAV